VNIKRYLLKILILLVLVGSVTNADILVVPFYEIHEKSVYYRTENGLEKLQNADAKTFEIFKESKSFGRDKNNVYYLGDKLNKIDPKTFEVVEGYYITMFKDKNGIYTFGKNYDKLKIINFKENGIDIDFNNFKVISSENPTIYRNKNDVYFQKGGKIYPIKNVDAKTFEKINGRSYLDNKYYRDKNDVYYFSSDKMLKLENADRNSVNELSKNILRVYYIDENKKTLIKFKNNEIDIESFGIANKMLDDYFKDKNNVYYLEDYKLHRLDDLDIETYQNIFMTRYKKDKNNLYFKWKKVKGANPDDIEIIENNFIKIKNTLYKISNFEGKEAEIEPLSVDADTFEEIDNNYYRDKNHVYFYKDGNLQKLKNTNVKNFKMLKESSDFGKAQSNIYYKGYKLEQVDKDSFEILDEAYDGSIVKDKNSKYYHGERIK